MPSTPRIPPRRSLAAELAAACDEAILRLLEGAQQVTYRDRSYAFADLETLRRLRAELWAEADAESLWGQGGVAYARFN